MNEMSWRGRRVLVTGHTGFKGGWLCLWLGRLGAEVTGFALAPPEGPSLFEDVGVGEGMMSVIGDLRGADAIEAVVRDCTPEVVFHLAAQPLVRASYRDPALTYATNVMGTIHLLEAIRAVDSVRAVVVATTDKVYENVEWHWPYRETDRLGGRDPYASSKACAELAVAAYRTSFLRERDIRVATARAGNVIGGGDWAEDRLIPDLMRSATRGESIGIRSPRAVRPWQHVLDPLDGYLRLASRLLADDGARFAEAWNFGPPADDAKPVGWVVDALAKRWDRVSWTNDDGGDHPHEATVLKLDSSQAIQRLDWRPALTLETALDWVADWYQASHASASLRALTLAQIAHHESLVAAASAPPMDTTDG